MTLNFAPVANSSPHLFVAVMPTPNGRLHLGHMSGPYLKVDILARHLRSRGVEAHIVSGADAYESHVELKALQTDSDEHAVATKFHGLIERELAALHIDCAFTDPLRPEVHDEYVAFNRRTVEQLEARGLVETLQERVGYSPATGRYVAGCWISGTCPLCGAGSGSYFCEDCGTHYKPEDLRNAGCNFDSTDIKDTRVESLFLRLSRRTELDARLQDMAIPSRFRSILARYFETQGELVRLTNPGRWGMQYGAPDRVIFTYTVGLLSFSLFCAELLKRSLGLTTNPFARDSDYVTVASFGIDNTVPYLAGVLGAAVELDDIKPFDYFLTNYFYNLEGKKFSTNRNHLTCGSDLVFDSGVSPDALRYFLAKVNPEAGPKDFVVAEFMDVNNRLLAGRLEAALARAFTILQAGTIEGPPAGLLEQLERVLESQDSHLRLPTTHMARATGSMDAWQELGEQELPSMSATDAYWWLKGLAVVAYPFMPVLTQKIWHRLGHEGTPGLAAFLSRPPLDRRPDWQPVVTEVSSADVERNVSRGVESVSQETLG